MGLLESTIMICKYALSPRRVGSVCPSSSHLAKCMVKQVLDVSQNGVIVELGAGTGAITEYIIKAGISGKSKLHCIEFDKKLCQMLTSKFANANIINGSAENIRELLGEDTSNDISAIISGLPLVSLPKDCVANILEEVESSLSKGGKFVQFTYNLNKKPSALGFKNMKHIKKSTVILNIPPARVDVFEKI